MTTTMMILLAFAFVLALACIGIELSTNHKFAEWSCTVMAIIAGIILGVTICSPWLYDTIHGIPPRAIDVGGVKFEEDLITLPRPTELGSRWVIITSQSGPTGTVVMNDRVNVPKTDKTVKLYLMFPDGRTSPAVEINNDGTASVATITPIP